MSTLFGGQGRLTRTSRQFMMSMHMGRTQEFIELGFDVRLGKFVTVNHEDPRPSDEDFMKVVKSLVKADKFNIFQKFMQISNVRSDYLSKAEVLKQVIEELISADRMRWMKVVCRNTNPTMCVNEKLLALWTSKKYVLLKKCFQRSSCQHQLPRLSLDTVRTILAAAVPQNASVKILNSVIVIAKATDFLTCVLQLYDQQPDPAVRNLVDKIFLRLNVLELSQEQMKLLSVCSKREVVFGKILLQVALRGRVCPLPRSLQTLGTLDRTYFGVLDLEFLAPLFTQNQFLRCVESSMARDTRDVVILLIRSGLLHKFGSWLKTQLEECRRKGCTRCKYCDASNYLVHPRVPDGPAIQQLLLQSGFLPNRLLFQLQDVLPKPALHLTRTVFTSNSAGGAVGSVNDEEDSNSDNNDNVTQVRPYRIRPPSSPPISSSSFSTSNDNIIQAQRYHLLPPPPLTTYFSTISSSFTSPQDNVLQVTQYRHRPPPPPPTSPLDMESVVKAFVQQPYSLLIMTAAKVSTMIGCHCGRTERIKKLPVPKLVQDHVAFRAGSFKLACEKEQEIDAATENSESYILTPDDIYADDDDDLDHLYSEEEKDVDDDGEDRGGYLQPSAAGEAAVQMEIEPEKKKRRI